MAAINHAVGTSGASPLTKQMLAAVDMGANSFHMVVVKVEPNGRFRVIDSEKEYVKLGSGTLNTGTIQPEAEQRAIDALKRFKKLAESHKADMRVVATSAVREAKNRGKFVRNVAEETEVQVEVLSGKEEANLIYLGILQALPVYDKTVLAVDIGGGSTEFVLGHCGEMMHATSLKLGHIRLAESFLCSGDGELDSSQIAKLRRCIRDTLADTDLAEKVREIGFEMAIGSSGTIESIEQMIHQGHAVEWTDGCQSLPVFFHAFRDRKFTKTELSVIVQKLCRTKNKEECAKLLGFTGKNSDSIVAGAILLQEIFEIFGINEMKISPCALREGVIADTLAKACKEYRFNPNVRWSSVISLARRFNSNKRMKSALHSAQLAKELLDGLNRCKEEDQDCFSRAGLLLNENDIELMEAATVLHGIGMFIGHKGYHKHSYYLIKVDCNASGQAIGVLLSQEDKPIVFFSEKLNDVKKSVLQNNEHLYGYSSMEIEIIALLARYHRKKFPSHKHGCFVGLPEEVKKKIRALCVIVRIAVALERCNFTVIQQVHVMHVEGHYRLVATPSIDPLTGSVQDASLEIWAAQTELKHFEEVFKRKMSVTVASDCNVTTLQAD